MGGVRNHTTYTFTGVVVSEQRTDTRTQPRFLHTRVTR